LTASNGSSQCTKTHPLKQSSTATIAAACIAASKLPSKKVKKFLNLKKLKLKKNYFRLFNF
jgi:hypothetical protein